MHHSQVKTWIYEWSNGLLKETSSSCKIEVNLPGITAKLVFSLASTVFMFLVTWASKASQTSKLLLFPRPPPLKCQTFSIHVVIPLVSIQHFSWAGITTLCLFATFKRVFLLKITIGFSLLPSPAQANSTVTWLFSFPVIQILIVSRVVHGSIRWHVKC